MSELVIPSHEFFNLSEKKGDLCAVKFCRNPHRANTILCHKCTMRLWRARNPMRSAFHTLRLSATRRKILFKITLADFESICRETGYLQGKCSGDPDGLTIDRIRNHEGYVPGNLRVITMSENVAKGNRERKITLRNGHVIPLVALRRGHVPKHSASPLLPGLPESDWVDESTLTIIQKTSEDEPF